MRWAGQTLDAADDGALPGLERSGLVRSVQTPEFEGITFHEVLCKSALNEVPGESQVPFSWTVNPMRGCSHACRYCFARPTHEYLDLDSGNDFDSQIVVKTNVAAVLRKELSRRSWKREPVALGTNTDPYQRAEGRYRLMPGIIRALTESGTPFSILTKGTLLRRDLPLLTLAAQQVDVHVSISLAIHDADLQKQLEPGTPSPRARLDLVRAVRDAGLECGVLVAPVIPFLTDGAKQLDGLIGALAEAGATTVTALPMHLRSSTKDWYMSWLVKEHPALVRRYRQLYGHGAYVTPEYKQWLRGRIDPLLDKYGFAPEQTRSLPVNEPAEPRASVTSGPALTLF
ncbi:MULTISPECIES: Rv2578c family radical SAM protein [unclassified Rhodococcus (in: high G+C Gram-positive bacteria)]|uniref:Rv2578c family radical SAM protein n=1 Tax=unclassified Rhodococcus (in: high G+C Gram-positive bacteria) TaxID=192944 RepID=UPI000B9B4F43|nr:MULTISPECIES: Rv2578c family radical SAM protein [unclassified Rhodococcus (in: high G+C Gram-positive bacteria)]MDI6630080.1 Rv2578c family radical SAM protein [Rhodococcus sp. (in: high G+C Gram-positive bacteria)]OZE31497.1 radical SAM protein [Rhodococcus sp. 05-2254-4]OZE42427.1 radical SAM protein [Rhodococcus sp. 05-2254-3]OZE46583.1 radical SAM protein [Rhodococcus sp. 05-2254-2]